MTPNRAKSSKVLKGKISELPDHVLSFTLSFLPIREASRTSILSSRWRYLWKDSVKFTTSLRLDDLSMRGTTYTDQITYFGNIRYMADERYKFLGWVDQILQLGYGPVIDIFRLRFDMDKDFTHLIDTWINMAITKRAQRYDIDLSGFCDSAFDHPLDTFYTFPDWLFTQESGPFLKCLHLNSCVLRPLDVNCFSSLEDLQLQSVCLDQDSLANFLSKCLTLEKLALVNCWKLHKLSISGPSLKLKQVKVIRCPELCNIEVSARNLTRFEYCGWKVEFSFVDVRRLSNFVFCTIFNYKSAALSYALKKLSLDLPQLEVLFLVGKPLEERKIPRQLPVYKNLKKLGVQVSTRGESLWVFIHLLQASPFLHTLELHLDSPELESEYKEEKMPGNVPHLHLKEIMMSGFKAKSHELELMRYLFANCVALEKVTLEEGHSYYDYLSGEVCRIDIPENIQKDSVEQFTFAEERKLNQERTLEQLVPYVPHGVQFLVG